MAEVRNDIVLMEATHLSEYGHHPDVWVSLEAQHLPHEEYGGIAVAANGDAVAHAFAVEGDDIVQFIGQAAGLTTWPTRS